MGQQSPKTLRYLIPIKIRVPLNFASLIFAILRFRAPLIFVHPYSTVHLPFFHLFVAFFSPLREVAPFNYRAG